MNSRRLSKVIVLFICCIVLLSAGFIQGASAKGRDQEQCLTKQDVLTMLNGCRYGQITNQDTESPLVGVELTCNDVCFYYATNQWNTPLTCVGAFYHAQTPYGLTEPFECDAPFTINIQSPGEDIIAIRCTCCSPN